MKKVFYLMLMILCISCTEQHSGKTVDIEKSNTEDTRNYDVVKLFTVDGITVYRFFDKGYWRYFTNKGQVIDDTYPEKDDEDTETTLLGTTAM